MHRTRRAPLGVAALAVSLAAPAHAGEWPRFRGPNGSGVADDTGLPLRFGPEQNLEWATPVPFGRSSPVLGGGLLFLTSAEGEELQTLAIEQATGAVRWRRAVARSRRDVIHEASDSSTPSPATDGANVYVFFQELGLLSYDAAGRERWRHPLGPFANYYGMASSPVLAGSTLLLLCDQSSGSFLLALDEDTGAVRWRAERPGRDESYTTPVLRPATSPREVIVAGSKWVDAYDLETGEVTWSLPGVGAGPVASPVLVGDRLYVTAPDQVSGALPPPFDELLAERDADADGVLTQTELEGTWMAQHLGWLDKDGDGAMSSEDWDAIEAAVRTEGWGLFGIRLPGEGAPRPEIEWNYRRNVAYVASPIVVDGVLFTVEGNILTSLDARSGAVHERGRLGSAPARVSASPVAADGRIYFATLEGSVVVIDAAPNWQVLAINDLGAPIYATPLVADGRLYVRTGERLMSFALPAERGATAE